MRIRDAVRTLPWSLLVLLVTCSGGVAHAQSEDAEQPAETENPEAEDAESEPSGDETEDETTEAEAVAQPAEEWGPEATPAAVVDGPVFDADDDAAERELPDYDGREEVTTAGDVLIWFPRILFSPLYLVTEFVIRRPLGFIVTGLEEEEIPSKLIGLFTFGDEGQTLLVPIAFLEFGFRPSFGLFFRTSDFLFPGHSLSATASFGGLSWTHFSLGDSIASEEDGWELSLVGRWTRRPDGLFYGIGPDANDASRYAFGVVDGELGFDWNYWRAGRVGADLGLRSTVFDAYDSVGDIGDEPDIANQVDDGVYPAPPGYPDGYAIGRVRVHGSVDTRPPRPEPGTGVRLTGDFEYAFDLSDPDTQNWARYGGSLTGFVDLTGWQHVLSLTLSIQFADAFDGAIPFTELVDIGAAGAPDVRNPAIPGPMRGFPQGQLLGESGIAAVLEYRWPIWVFIDGSFQAAMGNAFNGQLDGFDSIDDLRLSLAWGLKTVGDRGNSFEFLIGMGTKRFGQSGGDAIESFRLAVGTSQAF